MRPIHLAELDETRPVVVLTRLAVRPHLQRVSIAPITTNVRGLSSEVPVGVDNGLEGDAVISCDNIVTVPADMLGTAVGFLFPEQERALAQAIADAFDLSLR